MNDMNGAGGPEDASFQAWTSSYGYNLPEETSAKSPEDAGIGLKQRYQPPKSDAKGIAYACGVIGLWALLYWHAMFHITLPFSLQGEHTQQPTHILHILAVFFSLEFMYTGLFITTHDAMHGTIAIRHRRINDFLGALAISLYAWFDYGMLHFKHWEHHNHTGKPHVDPDFHRGNPSLLPWFGWFMWEYISLWQFTKIATWTAVMQYLGAPMENILVFMTAAPLLSAFRLFLFGTYLPHRPEPGSDESTVVMHWPKSRTSQASNLQSFLTCYHFDLHWEHHRWPYAPWWELPKCR
ncbi:beta-carotene ketolase [Dunaliella salina]|uniref:Beta-carotene ketolase n=1 Tax=Dunaliella salina TaxID=3046 RepID=A0A8K1IK28_DUNSA|nr:beta-carotene ketolase [Dunaliella salina]UCC47244.1 beta-carotene ketolase [Dunaliella salina]|eukprot:KAF5838589.1 beta-carotene ketolase [Dunaliella salina]